MSRTIQPTENTFDPELLLLPSTIENLPAFDVNSADFDSLSPPETFQQGANLHQEANRHFPGLYQEANQSFPDLHLPGLHQEADPHFPDLHLPGLHQEADLRLPSLRPLDSFQEANRSLPSFNLLNLCQKVNQSLPGLHWEADLRLPSLCLLNLRQEASFHQEANRHFPGLYQEANQSFPDLHLPGLHQEANPYFPDPRFPDLPFDGFVTEAPAEGYLPNTPNLYFPVQLLTYQVRELQAVVKSNESCIQALEGQNQHLSNQIKELNEWSNKMEEDGKAKKEEILRLTAMVKTIAQNLRDDTD
ncbi:hypothetical protein F5X98DRAFT_374550 [Xylaria grammica]|nr:hypothetical protein F5X98DRAFT_374550 [Xylaria grammica]